MFFYNISDNNTLEQLNNIKNNYDVECEILINTEELLSYRTYRIANAINKLI